MLDVGMKFQSNVVFTYDVAGNDGLLDLEFLAWKHGLYQIARLS